MKLIDKLNRELAEQAAIITTTWYNPDSEVEVVRSRLALDMLRAAADLGYGVVVVDSGSSQEFVREIERYGVTVISEKHRTIGYGRRLALSEALKTDRRVIAWTEPEKVTYLPDLVKTVAPILGDYADLVIPKRRSLDSYPLFQQHLEIFGNLFWRELTGTDLDMWFGPRTWHRDISHYFLDYDGEYGDKWDCIYIPVLDAVIDQKRVLGVEVDYVNPAEQTAVEEHNLGYYKKRLEQLDNLTKSLAAHWEKRTGQKLSS
ncbi:MAG TPA: hypothetical protein VJG49_02400 [Candidatus Nanoarchaeia archaeon]|nr:hypothetical protein [Candidatus Nanoarchaeia archaeon]